MGAHSTVSESACSNQNSFRGPASHQIERRRLRRRQVGCREPRRDRGGGMAVRRCGGSGQCGYGAASAAAGLSYLLQRRWWRVPSQMHRPAAAIFRVAASERSRPVPCPQAPARRCRASGPPSAAPPPPRPVAVAAPLALPASGPAPVGASAGSSPRLLRAGVRVVAVEGAEGRQPRPGGGTVGVVGAGRRRRGRRWRRRWRGRRRWEVAGRTSRGCVTTPAELTSTPRPPQTAAPACAGWPVPALPPLCGRGGNPTTPHGARVADRASLTGGGLPPRPWRHHPRRRAARQSG